MDIAELRKQYVDAVRNLSLSQVGQVESGAPCQSSIMKRTRECYEALLRAETTLKARIETNEASFMLML